MKENSIIFILLLCRATAELIGFEGPIAGDLNYFVNNPSDVVSLSGLPTCRLREVKACTGEKNGHLCSVTLKFENCPMIAAKSTRCDSSSRFFDSKGNCNKSGPIVGPIIKFEGYRDVSASSGPATGFSLTTSDRRVYLLGNTDGSYVEA